MNSDQLPQKVLLYCFPFKTCIYAVTFSLQLFTTGMVKMQRNSERKHKKVTKKITQQKLHYTKSY